MSELNENDFPPLEPQPFVTEEGREIKRLRAELADMRKQRDEARRIVCIEIALDEARHYMGTHGYPCSNGPSAMEIAAERGWDCFAQKEEGAL